MPLLRDSGRIVTISSVATRMAGPHRMSFAMTKSAAEPMSTTLANELGVRLRRDQPEGWAGPLLPEQVNLAAHRQTHLSPTQAADVLVDTFLHGVGAS
jgi:NADP-dependent 3-hydroxy acid dehydrogenase YdfG